MAVLEAFVYDPLINWRLLTNNASPKATPKSGKKGDNGGMFTIVKKQYSPCPFLCVDPFEEMPRNFPSGRKLQKNENELVAGMFCYV